MKLLNVGGNVYTVLRYWWEHLTIMEPFESFSVNYEKITNYLVCSYKHLYNYYIKIKQYDWCLFLKWFFLTVQDRQKQCRPLLSFVYWKYYWCHLSICFSSYLLYNASWNQVCRKILSNLHFLFHRSDIKHVKKALTYDN